MTLRSFFDTLEAPDCRLVVIGGDDEGPLELMLAETFEGQPLLVGSEMPIGSPAELERSLEASDAGDPVVVLFEGESSVASSSMSELYNAILAINSDLYITGARGLGEVELPAVLANLDEFRFTLRGYPLAHKEKLLLIVISRYIEQLAWEAKGGTLRTSFQQLSRLNDEVGTRRVYEQLGASDLDVHVYGTPDSPITDLPVSVHSGIGGEYRTSWFVVFQPADPTGEAAALVALETEPRVWDGFWTYDPATVAAIDQYIADGLVGDAA